jgi:hypothetical protein
MKNIFIPKSNGTHVRISDDVRGDLKEFPDTAVIKPAKAIVDPSKFKVYSKQVAVPTPVGPLAPYEIANWRARAILEIDGLLASVESVLSSMPGDAGIIARSAWNAGAALTRHGATVTAIGSTLGLNASQIDAMFIRAAALEV